MTLPDAIRKGAEQIPGQARWTWFEFDSEGRAVSACAMAAAYAGIYGAPTREEWEGEGSRMVCRLLNLAEFQARRRGQGCPACPNYGSTESEDRPLYSEGLSLVLSHLNDEHHWTREEIADWLDARAGVPVLA
jgi:hypothetical protein